MTATTRKPSDAYADRYRKHIANHPFKIRWTPTDDDTQQSDAIDNWKITLNLLATNNPITHDHAIDIPTAILSVGLIPEYAYVDQDDQIRIAYGDAMTCIDNNAFIDMRPVHPVEDTDYQSAVNYTQSNFVPPLRPAYADWMILVARAAKGGTDRQSLIPVPEEVATAWWPNPINGTMLPNGTVHNDDGDPFIRLGDALAIFRLGPEITDPDEPDEDEEGEDAQEAATDLAYTLNKLRINPPITTNPDGTLTITLTNSDAQTLIDTIDYVAAITPASRAYLRTSRQGPDHL